MTKLEHRSSAATSGSGARTPGSARIALPSIIGIESWERFSYYGMQAIMAYYLYDTVTDGGLGLPTTTATALMGAYGSFVYLCTIAGGWIGDRLLGAERTLLAGAWVLVFGHLALSLIPGGAGVAVGLVFVAAGSGALKTSAIMMLGRVRNPGDPRRDTDFQYFYLGVQVGGLFGPLLTGFLSVTFNYHVGFAAAAVLMIIGLIHYHATRRRLSASWRPDVRASVERPTASIGRRGALAVGLTVAAVAVALVLLVTGGVLPLAGLPTVLLTATMTATVIMFAQMLLDRRISSAERGKVLAFIPMFIAAVGFWAIHNQAFGALAVYADVRVDRIIGGGEAPAAWSQSINPVFTLLLIIPLATLRLRLGHNPGIGVQMIGGTIFTGLALLVLVPFAGLPAGAVPLLALMATYLFITLGELHVSPVGMAASTVLAPARYRTRFSALYFLTMAVGTALAGTLSTYYDPTDATAERNYFLAVGLGVMAVAGLMALFLPRINRLVREGEKEAANDAAQESPAATPSAR